MYQLIVLSLLLISSAASAVKTDREFDFFALWQLRYIARLFWSNNFA